MTVFVFSPIQTSPFWVSSCRSLGRLNAGLEAIGYDSMSILDVLGLHCPWHIKTIRDRR